MPFSVWQVLSSHIASSLRTHSKADFQLFEDGKPQDIVSFSAIEAPFNVALLIDTSRSTRGSLGIIRGAAASFVNQLKPQDRVLIVTFDEIVTFHGDFTNDRRQLLQTINKVKVSYLTCLYDAITRTINEKLSPLGGRKAIVIFTDGIDTWSKTASCQSALDLVAHSSVPVYAAQYNASTISRPADLPCLLPPHYLSAPYLPGLQPRQRADMERQIIGTGFLRGLADQSGARYLRAEKVDKLEQVFSRISDELRHQYTIEYYSTNDQQDGGYRTIELRLNVDNLVVHTRQGYRAAKAESRTNTNRK